MTMMKSRKRLLAILLFIFVIGVIALVYFRKWNAREANAISVSGNIELTEVSVSFKVPGRLVELNVGEGSQVRNGQVIARLDREQLLRQRDRAQAALASAESLLKMLQTEIAYQKITIQGQIEQRQAELHQAEANLRDLLAGARTQEIRQARAALDEARTEFERAEKEWKRNQSLHQTADISAAQYEQARTRFESADAVRRTAEDRLALVVEGPRKESIEAARAQVDRAQASLKMADALPIELKGKQQEVETRRAEIARAKAEVALIESQLDDTIAVSTIDGVVLVKSAEPGEVLAAGTTVVTVGDLDHPWLRGYINERDLGRLSLGNMVRVKTDSFPGRVYEGRLSFISSQAEFTPKQIQTSEERVKLVYRIKIEISNPARELKSNMPADAEILLDKVMPEPKEADNP